MNIFALQTMEIWPLLDPGTRSGQIAWLGDPRWIENPSPPHYCPVQNKGLYLVMLTKLGGSWGPWPRRFSGLEGGGGSDVRENRNLAASRGQMKDL